MHLHEISCNVHVKLFMYMYITYMYIVQLVMTFVTFHPTVHGYMSIEYFSLMLAKVRVVEKLGIYKCNIPSSFPFQRTGDLLYEDLEDFDLCVGGQLTDHGGACTCTCNGTCTTQLLCLVCPNVVKQNLLCM